MDVPFQHLIRTNDELARPTSVVCTIDTIRWKSSLLNLGSC